MKKIIRHVNVVPNGEECFYGAVVLDEEGKIYKIFKGDFCFCHEEVEMIEGHNGYLMPGMVDIHMHGGYGFDVNKNPKESLNAIADGLIKEGTTSFLASLTVEDHDATISLLREYGELSTSENQAHFEGIHMEGPYLSVEKKALMNEKWIRKADKGEIDEMMGACNGRIRMMTIAPEGEGMDDFIPYASKKFACMIGHTNCNSETATKALNLGCKGFTHFYNAMSQHEHRNPGAVTAGLADDHCYCELIVDGNHVHKDVIKATYRAIGAKRIVLITDCMLARGMEDGEYTFSGLKCRKTGTEVHVIENGIFAGSVITQLDAIRNMKKFTGCTMNEIVQMACCNPADLTGIDAGRLTEGKACDLILLDKDLNLQSTWLKGRCVYSK